MQEARDGLDRIIAKLLEDLNNMGLAFHHPTNPFGLQPGEGSSKDLEGDVSHRAVRQAVSGVGPHVGGVACLPVCAAVTSLVTDGVMLKNSM